MMFDPSTYDAVVYDLDGTVVDLAVDWGTVADDVIAVYAEHAIKPPGDELWDLLDVADEYGIRESVEETVERHELAGARDSRRLPLADALTQGNPNRAAICSLNSEAACRTALETHDLADRVSAIIGRDTVATRKPDPDPLLAALDALDVEPSRAVFVGDSRRDAKAAELADVPFVWTADALEE